ncbi:hypothetical protein HNR50_001117 [Spirochaeta isovalerica]|uniref:Uncharacterized protein n=1 Tax=Spirochaeta isovalerica TaxID=150 RepID=A0A841R929_9SPIO|nr:hypothetical protein [Spirochaeta isovalerica]
MYHLASIFLAFLQNLIDLFDNFLIIIWFGSI